MNDFIHELRQAFQDELGTIFDQEIFIDKEALGGGDHFDELLAQALCESFCLIAVYVPKYETHPFCLREYRAMEILEERRIKLVGKSRCAGRGMIIPVVLRGIEDVPEDIRKHVHYLDFSKYTTASANIRKNEDYVSKIRKVAENMRDLYQAFGNLDPCQDCANFALPREAAPLRRSGPPSANPFPGSEPVK